MLRGWDPGVRPWREGGLRLILAAVVALAGAAPAVAAAATPGGAAATTTVPTTPSTTTAATATTVPTTPSTTTPATSTTKTKAKPTPAPKPKPLPKPSPLPTPPSWQPIVHPPDRVLSNETTHSEFAEAQSLVPIRTAHDSDASVIKKLALATPDGEAAQTYLLLREHWDVSISYRTRHRIVRQITYKYINKVTYERVGKKRKKVVEKVIKKVVRHVRQTYRQRIATDTPWVELRVPMRPNGHLGWVPRAALGAFQTTDMQVVVNRVTNYLTVYRGGKKIFSTRTGAGAPSSPTPTGHFWITEAFASTNPFYGPWAFGTSDYAQLTDFPDGSIVGIHGTDEPWLIPGNPSHGCVRVPDSDDVELEHLLSIGVPVLIKN